MDFFSYLQNSGNESIKKNKKIEQENLENINDKHLQNTNFKRGEVVIIQKYENSAFNTYKGYYAEIKKYNQNSDHAYVILPALNYPILIKIPINHFAKLETKYFNNNYY